MKIKGLMNVKNMCILLILILGVIFINKFFTIREGAEITAESVQSLSGDIKQSMDAAGVPSTASDTTVLFNQLGELMKKETAHQTSRARESARTEAEKNITPAGNTVEPTIINNSFFNGSKFSDSFCAMYRGTSALNEKCKALTEDNCNLTDCCVYVNGTKCMAGSARGPTTSVMTDADYYLYKYKCYGDCQVIIPKSTSKRVECSDDLTIVSIACLNQHGASLNCNSLYVPENFSGKTESGLVIANNQFDMSKLPGANWGLLKKMITAGIKIKPADCSNPNFIKDAFNLKN